MAEFALEAARGANESYTITVDEEGTPVDITGYTFFFTVKNNYQESDAQAKISKTWTSHSDPTAGVTILEVDDSDTENIPGEYVYDIKMKDTLGNLTYLFVDDFTITANATRRTT